MKAWEKGRQVARYGSLAADDAGGERRARDEARALVRSLDAHSGGPPRAALLCRRRSRLAPQRRNKLRHAGLGCGQLLVQHPAEGGGLQWGRACGGGAPEAGWRKLSEACLGGARKTGSAVGRRRRSLAHLKAWSQRLARSPRRRCSRSSSAWCLHLASKVGVATVTPTDGHAVSKQ